jgi:hypothetical protein
MMQRGRAKFGAAKLGIQDTARVHYNHVIRGFSDCTYFTQNVRTLDCAHACRLASVVLVPVVEF